MITDSTSYPPYYRHNWTRPVAPRPARKPYVPVRAQIAAPFLPSYAPKPAPVVAAVPAEFVAAFAEILRTRVWIDGYSRKSGVAVKGHLRRKAGVA